MADFKKSLSIELEPYRNRLIHHPVYAGVHTVEELRSFMEHHVYAVWDYMSLLKAMQREFTCPHGPWTPVGSAKVRRFINRLVLHEESDVDLLGNVASHFELYLEAMHGSGANTDPIDKLVLAFSRGMSVAQAMELANPPVAVQRFTGHSLQIAQKASIHELAAVFTMAREDLIPVMFSNIVDELDERVGIDLSAFSYYLKRHVQLEATVENSGPEILDEICDGNPQKEKEAIAAAKVALQHRIALWDSIVKSWVANPTNTQDLVE